MLKPRERFKPSGSNSNWRVKSKSWTGRYLRRKIERGNGEISKSSTNAFIRLMELISSLFDSFLSHSKNSQMRGDNRPSDRHRLYPELARTYLLTMEIFSSKFSHLAMDFRRQQSLPKGIKMDLQDLKDSPEWERRCWLEFEFLATLEREVGLWPRMKEEHLRKLGVEDRSKKDPKERRRLYLNDSKTYDMALGRLLYPWIKKCIDKPYYEGGSIGSLIEPRGDGLRFRGLPLSYDKIEMFENPIYLVGIHRHVFDYGAYRGEGHLLSHVEDLKLKQVDLPWTYLQKPQEEMDFFKQIKKPIEDSGLWGEEMGEIKDHSLLRNVTDLSRFFSTRDFNRHEYPILTQWRPSFQNNKKALKLHTARMKNNLDMDFTLEEKNELFARLQFIFAAQIYLKRLKFSCHELSFKEDSCSSNISYLPNYIHGLRVLFAKFKINDENICCGNQQVRYQVSDLYWSNLGLEAVRYSDRWGIRPAKPIKGEVAFKWRETLPRLANVILPLDQHNILVLSLIPVFLAHVRSHPEIFKVYYKAKVGQRTFVKKPLVGEILRSIKFAFTSPIFPYHRNKLQENDLWAGHWELRQEPLIFLMIYMYYYVEFDSDLELRYYLYRERFAEMLRLYSGENFDFPIGGEKRPLKKFLNEIARMQYKKEEYISTIVKFIALHDYTGVEEEADYRAMEYDEWSMRVRGGYEDFPNFRIENKDFR